MRELTFTDTRNAILGGGVLACGGGGWKHHGELMGTMATSLGRPMLATVDELPADSWVATVTAIGAPASKNWEILPVDYIDALKMLMDAAEVPISAVITGQNGYSTTLNGWTQSAALGVKVLDAAGDIRAHPTGKLGSLGLTERPGYTTIQAVSGGNRKMFGHFSSLNKGTIATSDDVLRDISVRVGGFIAAARNPVELDWVKEHAAIGAISYALDLGATMRAAIDAASDSAQGQASLEAVAGFTGGTVLATGPLKVAQELVTRGGWDHGAFQIGDFVVPYLNEYMAVENGDERVATYPDTIIVMRLDNGEALAVKDAQPGMEVALVTVPATTLPLSSSAVDPIAVGECEHIMGIEFLKYLPTRV